VPQITTALLGKRSTTSGSEPRTRPGAHCRLADRSAQPHRPADVAARCPPPSPPRCAPMRAETAARRLIDEVSRRVRKGSSASGAVKGSDYRALTASLSGMACGRSQIDGQDGAAADTGIIRPGSIPKKATGELPAPGVKPVKKQPIEGDRIARLQEREVNDGR